MTAWGNAKDDQVSMGSVDLAAPGETVAYFTAAVTGGPNCYEVEDGCVVYVNSGLGDESRSFDSHGINDIVAPGITKVFDATDDGVVSVINKVTEDLDTCGGLFDRIDGTLRWTTCDYQVQQISPDGDYVAAPQSQYDGLGPTQLSILDATVRRARPGRYSPEGGFIGTWAWTTDGHLLFDAYDGAQWHLFSMATDGSITEIGDPVTGRRLRQPVHADPALTAQDWPSGRASPARLETSKAPPPLVEERARERRWSRCDRCSPLVEVRAQRASKPRRPPAASGPRVVAVKDDRITWLRAASVAARFNRALHRREAA